MINFSDRYSHSINFSQGLEIILRLPYLHWAAATCAKRMVTVSLSHCVRITMSQRLALLPQFFMAWRTFFFSKVKSHYTIIGDRKLVCYPLCYEIVRPLWQFDLWLLEYRNRVSLLVAQSSHVTMNSFEKTFKASTPIMAFLATIHCNAFWLLVAL